MACHRRPSSLTEVVRGAVEERATPEPVIAAISEEEESLGISSSYQLGSDDEFVKKLSAKRAATIGLDDPIKGLALASKALQRQLIQQ